MKNVVKEMLIFGYDLENIENVQNHLLGNYVEDVDFELYIGIGDDVCNAIDMCFDYEEDKLLMSLIGNCEGEGNWID